MEPTVYNQQNFSNPIRRFHHTRRFVWLQKKLGLAKSILEIGCSDAKTLNMISLPERYLGVDSEEESLAVARKQFPRFSFICCSSPLELNILNDSFDVGICMETLEHLPPEVVHGYLRQMARLCKRAIFTVPVEIGIAFTAKHLVKYAVNFTPQQYTLSEFLRSAVCHPVAHDVSDPLKQHKGFDYRKCVRTISEYFPQVEVQGIFPGVWPLHANFNVGILARVNRA
jgi:SAM-dependent methyltransferase